MKKFLCFSFVVAGAAWFGTTCATAPITDPVILTDFQAKLNNALNAQDCSELKALRWYPKTGREGIHYEAARIQRQKFHHNDSEGKRREGQRIADIYDQDYLRAGVKLAQCGEWAHLWTNHYWLKPSITPKNDYDKHNATFAELEKELTGKGINLQTQTLKFMSQGNPDGEAVVNICKYFQHRDWYENGKEFTKLIKKSPFDVIKYIELAKYKPALKQVIPYLASNDDYERFAAVKALGEIGDKKINQKIGNHC